MSIKVDPDWWKTMFDEVYLLTDARSVCNEELTRREVDVICELLPVNYNHRILDLCGGHGRHAFELCERGFTGCTLLDYSQYLIDYAKALAAERNFSIDFVRSDARHTQLQSEFFDHVYIMGNSLGYIQEPEADSQILAEALRVLRSGGWLLVDVTDGAAIKDSFNPNAWHEIGDDIVVCRERELQGNMIFAREMVFSRQKGLIRERTYAIRLYEAQTLTALFRQTGFRRIKVRTDFLPGQSKSDYGFMSRRLIAVGQKP